MIRETLLALVGAVCCAVLAASPALGESPQATLTGIVQNMQANMAACTEEDMDKLLDCMSEEMPNRELFVQAVQEEWARSDCYHQLVDVKLLWRSNAEHARTDFPYATCVVTQKVTTVSAEQGSSTDLAAQFSVAPRPEVFRKQMLFKKERGKWKLIAGLTSPEPVDEAAECKTGRCDAQFLSINAWEPGQRWPAQRQRQQAAPPPAGRSAFN